MIDLMERQQILVFGPICGILIACFGAVLLAFWGRVWLSLFTRDGIARIEPAMILAVLAFLVAVSAFDVIAVLGFQTAVLSALGCATALRRSGARHHVRTSNWATKGVVVAVLAVSCLLALFIGRVELARQLPEFIVLGFSAGVCVWVVRFIHIRNRVVYLGLLCLFVTAVLSAAVIPDLVLYGDVAAAIGLTFMATSTLPSAYFWQRVLEARSSAVARKRSSANKWCLAFLVLFCVAAAGAARAHWHRLFSATRTSSPRLTELAALLEEGQGKQDGVDLCELSHRTKPRHWVSGGQVYSPRPDFDSHREVEESLKSIFRSCIRLANACRERNEYDEAALVYLSLFHTGQLLREENGSLAIILAISIEQPAIRGLDEVRPNVSCGTRARLIRELGVAQAARLPFPDLLRSTTFTDTEPFIWRGVLLNTLLHRRLRHNGDSELHNARSLILQSDRQLDELLHNLNVDATP